MELSQVKGIIGEGKVIRELNKLPRDKFFILSDVLLENNDYYVQIDHILISKLGIYLIETKNWTGDLYGDNYSQEWQLYNNYREPIKVYNPVKQSWTHKRGILNILEKENVIVPVNSILVFLENVNLRKVYADIPILQIGELVNYILNQDIINTQNILTFEEMKSLYDKINILNILDEEKRMKHISNVKSAHKDYFQNNYTWQDFKSKPEKSTMTKISLIRRFIAYILDLSFILAAFISIGFMGFISTDATILVYGLLRIMVILVIQCYFLSKGKSIGKKLLRIKVVNANTYKDISFLRMLAREFIGKFIISSFTYGLIYIVPLFTKKNQGVHDLIFKTIVVKDE